MASSNVTKLGILSKLKIISCNRQITQIMFIPDVIRKIAFAGLDFLPLYVSADT